MKGHTMKTEIDESIRTLRAAYYTAVKSLAEEVMDDSNWQGTGERSDRIHESVDGSEWVIYTWRNRVVALVSDNSSEALDEIESHDNIEAVRAYYAMRADVAEQCAYIDRHTSTQPGDRHTSTLPGGGA
jgi:hypothetical protein